MIKKISQILILFIILPFCFVCQTFKEVKTVNVINKSVLDFCVLANAPQNYQSGIIQTKGIVLGYHKFIFYSDKCLEQEKVIALEMDYESRQKIGEARNANKINYKKSFLNNNLYAEITVLGELKDNVEKNPLEIYHPKYKFFVKEIKEVNILSEEIYPNEKARGVETIKIK
ncbi:MAG: hypothetical protein M3405_02415 [Acidobacteriota bacterium]|nr:hypothetical protein [Acidobacteriota bacterium]